MRRAHGVTLGAALLLLACLGCRTPLPTRTLPIGDLEPGMKREAVRSLVGEPDPPEGSEGGAHPPQPGTWVYTDEVVDRVTLAFSIPLAPAFLLATPFITLASAIEGRKTGPPWIAKRTTTLYFEDERLSRWETELEPDPAWENDGSYQPTWQPPIDPWGWPNTIPGQRRRRGRGC